MKLRVRSLALLLGLRIRRCRELWCRLQMRLGSHVTVVLVWASGYSSDSTPSLGTSICRGSGPRKGKKTKNKNKTHTWPDSSRKSCGDSPFYPCCNNIIVLSLFFFFLPFFRAAPAAYAGSQARGQIGAAAAARCHSHSNTGSKPHLRPTPQLTSMPDP